MAVSSIGHNIFEMTAVDDQIPVAGTEVGTPPALPVEQMPVTCVKFIAATTGGLFTLTDIDGNVILSHTVAAGDTEEYHCGPGWYNGLKATALPANDRIIVELL